MKMKLKNPISFEGKEVIELNLDYDSLVGQDLIDAANEARVLGDKSVIVELSKLYQFVVSAKAAKVPSDLIVKLRAKDFAKVTAAAQVFLIE